MIFFGAGNYNKRDSVYRFDICESCGALHQMHSYTSTRAGHLYWIPVIPFGKKRIIDQCPSCNAGREMSYSQWKNIRNEEVIPLISELEANPLNREAAQKAIGLVGSLGNEQEYYRVFEQVAPNYQNDPEVLRQLSWATNRFQKPDEANALLEASLVQEEDANVRELLEFQTSAPRPEPPKPPSRFWQMAPLLIVPAVAIGILGTVLQGGLTKDPKHVYVVNGTGTNYEVLVNGESVEVPAAKKTRLDVEYGPLLVEAGAEGLSFEPISLELEADFWKRLGGGDIVVVNPDKTAFMVWEELVYYPDTIDVATEEMMDSGDYSYHAGDSVYRFDDVQYIFREAPENIEMSSDRAVKTQLLFYDEMEPSEIVQALLNNGDPKVAGNYVKAQLEAEPGNQAEVLLPFLPLAMEASELTDYTRKRIDADSSLIEWHRYYQTLRQGETSEEEVLKEYEARLAADPENGNLQYLAARLLPDGPEQISRFTASTKTDPPCPYGFFALAYHHWVAGDFSAARTQIDKAVEAKPDLLNFTSQQTEIMIAQGDWESVLKQEKQRFREAPSDFDAAMGLVKAVAASGQSRNELKPIVEKTIEANSGGFQLPPDIVEQYNTVLGAYFSEGCQNKQAYIADAKKIGTPMWNFYAAITEGDVRAAQTAIKAYEAEEDSEFSQWDHLILYASALTHGEESVSLEERNALVKTIEPEDPELAHWISGEEALPTLDTFLARNMGSRERCVLAVALAARHSENPEAAGFVEYAKKMNYRPDFPQMAINDLVAKLEK